MVLSDAMVGGHGCDSVKSAVFGDAVCVCVSKSDGGNEREREGGKENVHEGRRLYVTQSYKRRHGRDVMKKGRLREAGRGKGDVGT